MSMNKELQEHVIRKKFKNADLQDFDVEAHIDSSLTLPENIENLVNKGYLPSERPDNSAKVKEQVIATQKDQAIEMLREEDVFTEKGAETDGGITAENTLYPPLTEEEFALWLQNPKAYDIDGVDTEGDLLETKLGFDF
jgi:hypothetical protein